MCSRSRSRLDYQPVTVTLGAYELVLRRLYPSVLLQAGATRLSGPCVNVALYRTHGCLLEASKSCVTTPRYLQYLGFVCHHATKTVLVSLYTESPTDNVTYKVDAAGRPTWWPHATTGSAGRESVKAKTV